MSFGSTHTQLNVLKSKHTYKNTHTCNVGGTLTHICTQRIQTRKNVKNMEKKNPISYSN